VTIRPGERYQVRLTTDARSLSFLPADPWRARGTDCPTATAWNRRPGRG